MAEENIAQAAVNADRLRTAIRMRVRGAHWGEIATACGYPSQAAALRAVGEAMADATQRAAETADQMRDTANLRLSFLLEQTLGMLDEDAPVTYDEDGNPLIPDDRAVKLRAVDEARRLVTDIAKLNGVKPPETEERDDSGIRIVGVRIEDTV